MNYYDYWTLIFVIVGVFALVYAVIFVVIAAALVRIARALDELRREQHANNRD